MPFPVLFMAVGYLVHSKMKKEGWFGGDKKEAVEEPQPTEEQEADDDGTTTTDDHSSDAADATNDSKEGDEEASSLKEEDARATAPPPSEETRPNERSRFRPKLFRKPSPELEDNPETGSYSSDDHDESAKNTRVTSGATTSDYNSQSSYNNAVVEDEAVVVDTHQQHQSSSAQQHHPTTVNMSTEEGAEEAPSPTRTFNQLFIANRWEEYEEAGETWLHEQQSQKAATLIQKSYKGYGARSFYSSTLKPRVKQVIVIQTAVRCHLLAPRTCRRRRAAMVKIQSTMRRALAMRAHQRLKTVQDSCNLYMDWLVMLTGQPTSQKKQEEDVEDEAEEDDTISESDLAAIHALTGGKGQEQPPAPAGGGFMSRLRASFVAEVPPSARRQTYSPAPVPAAPTPTKIRTRASFSTTQELQKTQQNRRDFRKSIKGAATLFGMNQMVEELEQEEDDESPSSDSSDEGDDEDESVDSSVTDSSYEGGAYTTEGGESHSQRVEEEETTEGEPSDVPDASETKESGDNLAATVSTTLGDSQASQSNATEEMSESDMAAIEALAGGGGGDTFGQLPFSKPAGGTDLFASGGMFRAASMSGTKPQQQQQQWGSAPGLGKKSRASFLAEPRTRQQTKVVAEAKAKPRRQTWDIFGAGANLFAGLSGEEVKKPRAGRKKSESSERTKQRRAARTIQCAIRQALARREVELLREQEDSSSSEEDGDEVDSQETPRSKSDDEPEPEDAAGNDESSGEESSNSCDSEGGDVDDDDDDDDEEAESGDDSFSMGEDEAAIEALVGKASALPPPSMGIFGAGDDGPLTRASSALSGFSSLAAEELASESKKPASRKKSRASFIAEPRVQPKAQVAKQPGRGRASWQVSSAPKPPVGPTKPRRNTWDIFGGLGGIMSGLAPETTDDKTKPQGSTRASDREKTKRRRAARKIQCAVRQMRARKEAQQLRSQQELRDEIEPANEPSEGEGLSTAAAAT